MSGIGSFISDKTSKFSLGAGIISTPTSVTSIPASKLDEPDDIGCLSLIRNVCDPHGYPYNP